MTVNVCGQYLDVLLSSVLIARLFWLGLASKYKAFLAFALFDSVQSVIYIALRYLWDQGVLLADYRLVWIFLRLIAWLTTLWMVYALLILILRQLPGILKFSLKLLNVIIVGSISVALLTVRPEYYATNVSASQDWRARVTAIAIILERAFSFSELLTILSILTFVLFFPIRVPRNLAAFTAGLSIHLCFETGWLLGRTYLPNLFRSDQIDFPPLILAACLIFWIAIISPPGEVKVTTLGRAWQSVPKEQLIRQLESLNASLLRSREQS